MLSEFLCIELIQLDLKFSEQKKCTFHKTIYKNSESIYMLLQKKKNLSIEMSKQEVCIIHKCIRYITNYGNSQNF